MSSPFGVERWPVYEPLPKCQKVNNRRLKRAISKFRKELQHELEGDIQFSIFCTVPWLEEIDGQQRIVKGQEHFCPASNSTKGKKRK